VESVVRKLRLKHDRALAMGAPDELLPLITAFGDAGTVVDAARAGTYGFAIGFVKSMAEAREVAPVLAKAIEGDGLLWLAYPKGTSKRYKVDINRDTSWDVLAPLGFVPVANVAIDEDWSAMRFRKKEYSKSS
jgi:hypothetical protein